MTTHQLDQKFRNDIRNSLLKKYNITTNLEGGYMKKKPPLKRRRVATKTKSKVIPRSRSAPAPKRRAKAKAKANPWITFVKKVQRDNPSLTYGQAMQVASRMYR